MIFKSITIKNFLSFEDFTYHYPLQPGLHLIKGTNNQDPVNGSNGTGKSSTLAALTWVLYGVTPKGEKAGDLLNYNTDSKGYTVELTLEKDGQDYIIFRSWKPNFICINGKDVEEQQVIDLIGLTYSQFLATVLFRQNYTGFIDLTPSGKLSYLSELFGLDQWLTCSEICKTKISKLNTEVYTCSVTLDNLENGLEEDKKTIEELTGTAMQWEKDQHQKTIEIRAAKDVLDASIKTLEGSLSALRVEDKVKTLKAENNADISAVTEEISSLNKSKWEVSKDLATLDKAIAKFKESGGATCVSCLQDISHDHAKNQIKEFEIEKVSLGIKLQGFNTLSSELDECLKELNATAKELDKKLENERQKEANSRAERSTLEDKQALARNYERQLSAIATEKNPYRMQQCTLTAKVEKNYEKILTLQEDLKKYKMELDKLTFWQTRFPQIRLEILKEVVDDLEIYFNQALCTLGLSNWELKVYTEKLNKSNDNIKPELTIKLFRDGVERRISGLSGGEYQRIRFCIQLGLSDLTKSKNNVNINLLLLDEPMANLSEEGIDHMLSLFSTIANSNTVIMAEHRVFELAKFDGVISLVKGADGNTILQE